MLFNFFRKSKREKAPFYESGFHGDAYLLKFGEPFSVEVECAGMEPMSGLQFAVGINSSLDQRISTILSHGEERAFTLKQGEKKTGALKVDGLILTPGSYSLTLGIRDGTEGYDHLLNVIAFKVEAARHGLAVNEEMSAYGLIHVPRPEWTIL